MTATIPVDAINKSMNRRVSCLLHRKREEAVDVSANLTYAPLSDATCEVTGVVTDLNEYVIRIPRVSPSGQAVVAVAAHAFEGNTACRCVTLPATVQSIGDRAFAFCTGLASVEFAKSSRLSVIGKRAFIGCEALTDLKLPATVRECGEKAFAHCTALVSIRLGAHMTTLTVGMLEGCRKLTDVTLPMGLVTIESSALSTCLSLQSLALPATVQTIEGCAFAWCSHLSDIAIPARCSNLSPSAFYQCLALTTGIAS